MDVSFAACVDVLQAVFECLPPASLATVQLVCRGWRTAFWAMHPLLRVPHVAAAQVRCLADSASLTFDEARWLEVVPRAEALAAEWRAKQESTVAATETQLGAARAALELELTASRGVLDAARREFSSLQKNDFAEIRAFHNPPAYMKAVLCAFLPLVFPEQVHVNASDGGLPGRTADWSDVKRMVC